MFAGITRFDTIQADLGISRKVLAARLDELVARGILARRPYSEHPPRFDYVPTERGLDLQPVLLAIMETAGRRPTDRRWRSITPSAGTARRPS